MQPMGQRVDKRQDVSGLRERQKAERRRRMLDAASDLFNERGYEAVTIEDIASRADVSAATVHNYYKGKGRLLLAIVELGDAGIVDELKRLGGERHDSAIEAVTGMMDTITTGSLAYLRAKVWRNAIAASIMREDQDYGTGFAAVHGQFIETCDTILRTLQAQGLLPVGIDTSVLASLVYRIQHSLFVELIADDVPDLAAYRDKQAAHVRLILASIAPRG